MQSQKFFILTIIFLALFGCASPTRLDVDQFKLVREGKVTPANSHPFADCLLDQFDKAHSILMNMSYRQQRRADSFRVETTVGPTIFVSADIFDDGRVKLFEANSAIMINTSGEREAFDFCMKQFGILQ